MAGARSRSGTLALVGGATSALAVANTYRPLIDRGHATLVTYGAGLIPSELPIHTAAVVGGAAGLQVARGALRSRTGRVGTLLSAAAVVGLTELHRRSRVDRDVLAAALAEAFPGNGEERWNETDPGSWKLNPFPPQGDLLYERDVAYGPAGNANLLDIWRRRDLSTDAAAPVLLQIHGGAWTTGRKDREARPLLRRLAAAGWVCVSISYRLSPRATWPDHIVDVKRAIAWIRANIEGYGGDPSFVAATGGSAGGHLSAVAALTPNDRELQPGFESADTSVQAAIPHYGAFDIWDDAGTGDHRTLDYFERVVMKAQRSDHPLGWRQAAPIELPMEKAPPFFVIHGAVDALIGTEGPRLMVERLRSQSTNPVAYAELPRARHAFDAFETARTQRVNTAVEQFIETVRRT